MDKEHLTKEEIKRFLIDFKKGFHITTKDVYFHLDNYGVSCCNFNFEDTKYSYYTICEPPKYTLLEKCLQSILVYKLRNMRELDTAHIVSFINFSVKPRPLGRGCKATTG